MVMQLCEEIAPKHGLRALLAEKPFAGVNGSGKHNNWSISTFDGVQYAFGLPERTTRTAERTRPAPLAAFASRFSVATL